MSLPLLILGASLSSASFTPQTDIDSYMSALSSMASITNLEYRNMNDSCLILTEINGKEKEKVCDGAIVGTLYDNERMYQFMTENHFEDIFLSGPVKPEKTGSENRYKINKLTFSSKSYNVSGYCEEDTNLPYGRCSITGNNITVKISFTTRSIIKKK